MVLQPVRLYADNSTIDSLRQRLEEAHGIYRVAILNDISRAYWNVSLDMSLEYAREALELAEYYDDKKEIADALNRLGNAEYLNTNYDEAIIHYLRSLELRLNVNDSSGILGSYNNLYLAHDVLGNKDLARECIIKALDLSISGGSRAEIAHYSNIMGAIFSEQHDFDNAESSFDRAMEIYEEMDDVNGLAATFNNMGSMYHRMSLYDNAQECYFRALAYYRESANLTGLAWAKNNIGIIHQQLNNLDIALDYFNRSLAIYQQQGGARRNIASVLNNIGIIWFEKGDFQKSLEHYQQALENYEMIKDISGIATASHNTGIGHTRLGNYQEALESFLKSLEINISMDNRFSIANNYNNLGELYLLQKEYDKALEYLDQALKTALELNAKEIIIENHLFRSRIFHEKGEFEKSLLSRELYDTYRDSVYTVDTGSRIAELQVRYNKERQISELELLQKDNHIQMLRIRKEQTLILYLGGIALLTALMVFLAMGFSRYKMRLNRVLQDKNSQLENANMELIQTEKNLQRLNATKDKFFSIIAHDLKNPFNALLGFSETLNQNFKDLSREQIYTYIEIINKSAINLFQLLENLLEWSKSQTGNIQYSPGKFNLREIAETGTDTLTVNAKHKNITIRTDIDPALTAFADKNLISTVIRNLVSNAVKFTHHNGNISISARENKKYIEVSVADKGIGIEAGEQKKLFSLDHNITTAGTDNERGTGLGLVLCKEFVEKSGGRIWVESEPGKGSTFKFTIPK